MSEESTSFTMNQALSQQKQKLKCENRNGYSITVSCVCVMAHKENCYFSCC